MRQVPAAQKFDYVIIGSGKVASHLRHWFSLLGLPFKAWSRKADPTETLESLFTANTIALLAISDSALSDFTSQHVFLKNNRAIHFSGCLSIDGVFGAHPLASFSEKLLSLPDYNEVPFVIDFDQTLFLQFFPQLKNPTQEISPQQKPLYHALCVMSGNFTVLLWQKFFKELEEQFKIPTEFSQKYLQSIFANLQTDPKKSLTGPLARNDQTTIEKNLYALQDDPYQQVYRAFLSAYKQEALPRLKEISL